MIYSYISIVAMLGTSAAATNTAIISGAIENISADEIITSNENIITERVFMAGSRVGYNDDTNNKNNKYTFFAESNYDGETDERNLNGITPTLWPTYAPTPLTKAPSTPIPTYSPTQLPTTTLSPPTPSPSITATTRSPTSAPTPPPPVPFITGTATAFPGGSPAFEEPAASPVILPLAIENTLEPTASSIISSPTPYPTWNPVSEDESFVQTTAIPTNYWRRRNTRDLRHTKD